MSSSRSDYDRQRRDAYERMTKNVGDLETAMFRVTRALASPDNLIIAALAREVVKSGNHLSSDIADSFFERGKMESSVAQLDELTVVGPDSGQVPNPVLIGHARGTSKPEVRRLANLTLGARAYFAYHTLWDERGGKSEALLVEGSALSIDRAGPDLSLAFVADRRVGDDVLTSARSEDVMDARIVLAKDDRVIVQPKWPDKWTELAKEPLIRVPLPGADGDKPIAYIEIAVNNKNLEGVLAQTTLVSAVLALVALGGVVLIGLGRRAAHHARPRAARRGLARGRARRSRSPRAGAQRRRGRRGRERVQLHDGGPAARARSGS